MSVSLQPLTVLLAILAGLRLSAAATAASPDDAPPAIPGHSSHGQAFDEGPRQAAYRMLGMPEVHFAVTTTNPLTQQFFTQGVGQLHGFWYFEAERSFRQAVVHDTNCAMAYWGLAMANPSNTNRAVPFLRDAMRLRGGASHREQLWIDARAEFHLLTPESAKRDDKERHREYIRSLENIVYEFPEDIEAKAFLAVTIWNAAGQGWPISSAQGVESLLKEIFSVQPMHPAHHYRIHLWDGEKDPAAIRALPSAARDGQSGPGIAHLWHMSGHTFNKLKRYDDMAWQQEASQRVDHAQLMRDRILPDQIHNYAHNGEWLVQTLNYVGRVRDALTLAMNLIELPQHPRYNALGLTNNGTPYRAGDGGSANHGRRRLIETLLRYELWDDAVRLADTFYLEPTNRGLEQARRARLLGVAHFAQGHTNEGHAQFAAIERAGGALRVERAAVLDAAEAKARADRKPDDQVKRAMTDVLDKYADSFKRLDEWTAELRLLESLPTGTLADLTNQVTELKSVSKERLARIWLQLGATNQAETVAREAVDAGTNQVQLLANLAEIQWQLGRTNAARSTFERLRSLSSHVDLEVPAFQRLQPLLTGLQIPADWRAAPVYREDSGVRPDLASLGPLVWKPMPAPEFSLPMADGNTVSLADYRGRPLLLFFYLGHGCIHCLDQLNALAPAAADFRAAGIDMLAISADSADALIKTQEKARAAGGFPFPLLADARREVFRSYRTFDDFEAIPLHGVFLIDGSGLIRWQDIGPDPFTDVTFLLTEAKRQLQQISDQARLPKGLRSASAK